MEKRTALLLGNGKYAINLHQKLRVDRQDTVLTIALFPEGEAAVTGADYCVDVLSPGRVIGLLKAHGITHVIFAGNFRLRTLMAASSPVSVLRAIGDVQMYNFIFNWAGGGAGYLTRHFCDLLRENGFEPIAASEVLPDLNPGPGVLVSAGALAGRSAADIEELVTRPAQLAVRELDNQPRRHVRQAFLFEGDELLLRNARGTDALLEAAQTVPKKPGCLRMLIKLCPNGFDPRMDPPVVGPKTFQLAQKAQVDLVVLDSDKGILFDRDRVAEICAGAGISVYGLKFNPAIRELQEQRSAN